MRAIDVDVELHHLPRSWPYADQCVDGDCWIGGVDRQRLVVIFLQNLDAEYLLADLLMPVGEKLITMEALAVLPALRDLHRCQALDGSCRFGRRGSCSCLG
jgi:hypothetical protein